MDRDDTVLDREDTVVDRDESVPSAAVSRVESPDTVEDNVL